METLEFGAEKNVLQGKPRRIGGSCTKAPNSPMIYRKKHLWAKFRVRNARCVSFFWLVGGEVTGLCSRNPVLSLKWPSSTWVGALVPAEERKDIAIISLEEKPGSSFNCCIIVFCLLPFCFFTPLLSWLVAVWICPFWLRTVLGGWIKLISYKQEMGTWKYLYLGGPHRVLFSFKSINAFSLFQILNSCSLIFHFIACEVGISISWRNWS